MHIKKMQNLNLSISKYALDNFHEKDKKNYTPGLKAKIRQKI